MVGSAQVERVVGDDHVDTGVDGLVDDGRHGVDGQEDAAYRVGGIPADEPVGVPRGRQAGGRGCFHEGDDIADAQGAVQVLL